MDLLVQPNRRFLWGRHDELVMTVAEMEVVLFDVSRRSARSYAPADGERCRQFLRGGNRANPYGAVSKPYDLESWTAFETLDKQVVVGGFFFGAAS